MTTLPNGGRGRSRAPPGAGSTAADRLSTAARLSQATLYGQICLYLEYMTDETQSEFFTCAWSYSVRMSKETRQKFFAHVKEHYRRTIVVVEEAGPALAGVTTAAQVGPWASTNNYPPWMNKTATPVMGDIVGKGDTP
jgi:hypothetical protein